MLTEINKIITLETVLDKPEELLRELQQTLVLEPGTYICRCQHHLEIFTGFKLHKTQELMNRYRKSIKTSVSILCQITFQKCTLHGLCLTYVTG